VSADRRRTVDPVERRTFEEELLFGDTSDTFDALLDSAGVTRTALAARLGVSPGRVTQLLSGGENLTLRTVAALSWALGLRAAVHLESMSDRAGTPAVDDPPPPAWLGRLQHRRAGWRYLQTAPTVRRTATETNRTTAIRVGPDGTVRPAA
jgi:transcriptional regulator with XRE-family HTH domain